METKSKTTQRNKIIDYIRENGSATVRELFLFCNINSPTKRLSELRQMGLIDTVTETKRKEDGTVVRFCRYYLRKGDAA